MDESKYLDRERVPLSSIESEMALQVSNVIKGGMDMKASKKKEADETIPKKKKKRAEMDLEISSSSKKTKRRPMKKAVLVESRRRGKRRRRVSMDESKKKEADETIPKKKKKKKKRAEMDLEISSSSKKPKRRPMKKAVLVGLKPPAQMMMDMNSVDVKAQILRMKKHLMEQRGFPEDKIILIIEDEEDTKPTATNIREHLYRLVEYSDKGDILFIHLIAYGCSDGLIITPDQIHIEDTYFRSLIYRAVILGLNLTFVSDCLIQPKGHCPCPRAPIPDIDMEGLVNIICNPKLKSQATFAIGYYGIVPCTNLSHVDILTLQGEDEDKTITQTETTTTATSTRLPSRVILFTPFPCDHNVSPHNLYDVSEVVFPPPTGHKHRPYGAFTNSILNVIEETRGRVTNLELAQKTMLKLGGQTLPRLSCSHLNYARAPFVC